MTLVHSLNIRAYRETHHLTQSELAAQLGVDHSTVARWETGTSRPSRLAQMALAWLTTSGSRVRG